MIYALAVYFMFNLVLLFVGNLLTPKEQAIKFSTNLVIMLLGLPMFLFTLMFVKKGGN